jgi:hypothetical protein
MDLVVYQAPQIEGLHHVEAAAGATAEPVIFVGVLLCFCAVQAVRALKRALPLDG